MLLAISEVKNLSKLACIKKFKTNLNNTVKRVEVRKVRSQARNLQLNLARKNQLEVNPKLKVKDLAILDKEELNYLPKLSLVSKRVSKVRKQAKNPHPESQKLSN